MKEEKFKPIAKKYLERLGFEVFEIEKKQGVLTPDFEAIGKNDKYTIELKEKSDDPKKISSDDETLSRGEFLIKNDPIGLRNTLEGIIDEGVQQIKQHDPKGESFRIIWLHSAGRDPSYHNMRFHSTLFGIETFISLDRKLGITCYYFHESAFFSFRNYLDGAILTYYNEAQLCINSLSPRVEQFRKSELVVSLSNGLCDPQKLAETSDDVMIADCEIDRRCPDKVVSYLKGKYGLEHLLIFPMELHTSTILLPMNEDG